MHLKRIHFFVLLAVLTCMGLISGCSKLTMENYNLLKAGMDYQEVIEILGEADVCSAVVGMKNCKWRDDDRYITIKFVGDKVVLFSGHGL